MCRARASRTETLSRSLGVPPLRQSRAHRRPSSFVYPIVQCPTASPHRPAHSTTETHPNSAIQSATGTILFTTEPTPTLTQQVIHGRTGTQKAMRHRGKLPHALRAFGTTFGRTETENRPCPITLQSKIGNALFQWANGVPKDVYCRQPTILSYKTLSTAMPQSKMILHLHEFSVCNCTLEGEEGGVQGGVPPSSVFLGIALNQSFWSH